MIEKKRIFALTNHRGNLNKKTSPWETRKAEASTSGKGT